MFYYKVNMFNIKSKAPTFLSQNFQAKTYKSTTLKLIQSKDMFSKSCFRFIVSSHSEAGGLGHRFGSVVFAVNLALEFGFELVLHDDLWTGYDVSQVTTYTDFQSILKLNNFMSYSILNSSVGKNMKTYFIKSREEFLNLMLDLSPNETCNITVIAKLATAIGCNNNYCFLKWPGSYQRAKTFFKPSRLAINQIEDKNKLILYHKHYASKELTVAWHIRCGDIVVKRKRDFFVNINQVFIDANVLVHHFFFSERICSEFEFLRDVFVNYTVLTLSLSETVLNLQNADVLVHIGSSLTPASYITGPQTGLYFESQPKDLMFSSENIGAIYAYHILSAINFDLDGLVSPVTQGQCNETACVRQYVQDLYRMRYGGIQSKMKIHEDLEEKYVVQDLNNSNYDMCLELVDEIANRKGVWIVKLLYNSVDMIHPLEVFRNQMHVELIDVRLNKKYLS